MSLSRSGWTWYDVRVNKPDLYNVDVSWKKKVALPILNRILMLAHWLGQRLVDSDRTHMKARPHLAHAIYHLSCAMEELS
jgi:hypothetical protein